MLKLIRQQETAARRAEREEVRRAEAEREEIRRLIMSQGRARRAAEAQDRAAARKLARLSAWFERQAERDAEREEQAVARKLESARKTRERKQAKELDRWERQVEKERAARGVTKRERQRLARQEKKARKEAAKLPSVEEYIMAMMHEGHDCLEKLGFKVRDVQPWRYPDGSFDVQLTIDDPDDTNGAKSLLKLQECIRPVIGASIAVGSRHYASGESDRRVDYATRNDKPVPHSLANMEQGKFTNLTNYRNAGVSEIAEHFDAWHKFLLDYGEKNRAYCAELFVRFHYSSSGKVPR
jgi:hypothetical protein